MDSDTHKLDPQDAARIMGTPATPPPMPEVPRSPTTPMPPVAPVPAVDPIPPVAALPPTNGPYPSPAVAPRPVAPPMFGSNSNIIPFVLIVLGALLLFTPLNLGDLFGSAIVLVIGLVFLYVYGQQGRNIGFLIPGSIMTGLGLGIVAEAATGMNGLVPLGLGLGFCAIWFMQRSFWWALIPGGIIALAGLKDLANSNDGSGSTLGSLGLSGGSWWPLLLVGAGIWLVFSRNGRVRR